MDRYIHPSNGFLYFGHSSHLIRERRIGGGGGGSLNSPEEEDTVTTAAISRNCEPLYEERHSLTHSFRSFRFFHLSVRQFLKLSLSRERFLLFARTGRSDDDGDEVKKGKYGT